MASFQGPQPSRMNKRESVLVFIGTANDSNVLSTIVTHPRRHTELTEKIDNPDGKPVLCQRTFSAVFLHC
jgi:hypothetical protein